MASLSPHKLPSLHTRRSSSGSFTPPQTPTPLHSNKVFFENETSVLTPKATMVPKSHRFSVRATVNTYVDGGGISPDEQRKLAGTLGEMQDALAAAQREASKHASTSTAPAQYYTPNRRRASAANDGGPRFEPVRAETRREALGVGQAIRVDPQHLKALQAETRKAKREARRARSGPGTDAGRRIGASLSAARTTHASPGGPSRPVHRSRGSVALFASKAALQRRRRESAMRSSEAGRIPGTGGGGAARDAGSHHLDAASKNTRTALTSLLSGHARAQDTSGFPVLKGLLDTLHELRAESDAARAKARKRSSKHARATSTVLWSKKSRKARAPRHLAGSSLLVRGLAKNLGHGGEEDDEVEMSSESDDCQEDKKPHISDEARELQDVLAALSIPPEKRSYAHHATVCQYLGRHVTVFAHLDISLQRKLAQHCTLVEFSQGSTIVEEGSQLAAMYVLLSGVVYSVVPAQADGEKSPSDTAGSPGTSSAGGESKEVKQNSGDAGEPWDDLLSCPLHLGESFGHAALQTETFAAVTMVARERSYLLSLTRNAYKKVQAEYTKQLHGLKIDFLKKVPIFQKCNALELNRAANAMFIQNFSKNSVVTGQGRPATHVHFVMRGQVRVVQRAQISGKGAIVKPVYGSDGQEVKHGTRRPKYTLIDLGVLGPTRFFGEFGVVFKRPNSAFVYAHSDVLLLSITSADFNQRLPPSCAEYCKAYSDAFYASTLQSQESITDANRWELFKERIMKHVVGPVRGSRSGETLVGHYEGTQGKDRKVQRGAGDLGGRVVGEARVMETQRYFDSVQRQLRNEAVARKKARKQARVARRERRQRRREAQQKALKEVEDALVEATGGGVSAADVSGAHGA